jgi:hypothetical protein
MSLQEHLTPSKARPDIEWSVTMSTANISSDRFVIYGLDESTCSAFLAHHGVASEQILKDLKSTYGPPSQVAVGRDGERVKIYWFLASRDPYFIGLDFVDGKSLPPKVYVEYEGAASGGLLDDVEPHIKEPLTWLLGRPELASANLFHLVAFRRSPDEPFAGVHLGIKPDWFRLLGKDVGVLYPSLIKDFLGHLGFQHHWERVRECLLEPPMAWTCYVSVQWRPSGELGATVYGRSSPVVALPGGLALVEPGDGGTLARPVVISCSHDALPGLRIRFRFEGPSRSFVQANGWFVDYSAVDGQHVLPATDKLEIIESFAIQACGHGTPHSPNGVADWLKACPGVYDVFVGPDLRKVN